jgi:hypothetical protein
MSSAVEKTGALTGGEDLRVQLGYRWEKSLLIFGLQTQ